MGSIIQLDLNNRGRGTRRYCTKKKVTKGTTVTTPDRADRIYKKSGLGDIG